MKVTIRDIAKMAGTSPSSVSLVLNSKPGVRMEMRKQIEHLLLENGYTLKNQPERSPDKRNICFVYYKSTNWIANRKDNFLIRVLDGVERACSRYNCSISIINANYDNVSRVLGEIKREQSDGIIFLGTEFAHRADKIMVPKDVPFVCIDRYFEEEPINTVNIDNLGSLHTAIRYLMQLGHRRIGYLTSDLESGALEHRKRSFFEAMERLGLEVRPEYVVYLNMLREEAEKSLESYIKNQSELPTAFLACNDVMAIAAIGIFQRFGYRVPQDISVIGFDNSGICDMIVPGLTTIHADLERMGELAVERLQMMLGQDRQEILKVTVGTKLIHRETAGPTENVK